MLRLPLLGRVVTVITVDVIVPVVLPFAGVGISPLLLLKPIPLNLVKPLPLAPLRLQSRLELRLRGRLPRLPRSHLLHDRRLLRLLGRLPALSRCHLPRCLLLCYAHHRLLGITPTAASALPHTTAVLDRIGVRRGALAPLRGARVHRISRLPGAAVGLAATLLVRCLRPSPVLPVRCLRPSPLLLVSCLRAPSPLLLVKSPLGRRALPVWQRGQVRGAPPPPVTRLAALVEPSLLGRIPLLRRHPCRCLGRLSFSQELQRQLEARPPPRRPRRPRSLDSP